MFSWFSFLTYAWVTAITPGPNNIMSLSNAAKVGFRKSLPFNLGIFAGFCIVMVTCAIFCNALTTLMPKVEFPLRIIGASYILYLAYCTWKSHGEIQQKESNASFFTGLFLQFINPKIYVYGIVSMQVYILPFYKETFWWILLFALLLAFIGFVCTVLWAGFGSLFTVLFSKHAKITNGIMSALLVYCAMSFFM